MKVLRTLLASLLLLAAGLAVLAVATHGFRAYTSETARRIDIREHPRTVPSTPLQTADGQRTSFGELRGRWLLVDFIYTRCLTYCSVQGSEFARLQQELAGPIAADKVALLSISFDPARDDPTALADYQRRHGDRGTGWIAARPVDRAGLAELLHRFGVVAVPDGIGGFVHNAAIAVVDPGGRIVAILDWNDWQAAAGYVRRSLRS
ncbi:MAG: SCO family protein [Rhodanobacter sp.]|nr:MAG: SCO family protein [Rhodanobacter sp.]TAM34938.1 MAG: SCO family protein [Rhodanobacter sp.]